MSKGQQKQLYVQFGAGLTGPTGWLNFDNSPTLRLQRLPALGALFRKREPVFPEAIVYGDVLKGLPVPDGSCGAVYCSHVLEHLSLDDFRAALREVQRCLEPGGCFRFVLPDLKRLAQDYVDAVSDDASMTFMKDAYLGKQSRPRGVRGLLTSWLGNASHLWMWDYKSMAVELEKAGFSEIRKAQFGDSHDAKFSAVETLNRWEGCLGVDCRKPG